MKAKYIAASALVCAGILNTGCSAVPVQTAYGEMPQFCTQNNTAAGAVLGALAGAALGAAIGGDLSGAAIGAGSGLVLGATAGAVTDTRCRELAYQRVLDMAAAQQTASAVNATVYQSSSVEAEYFTPSNGLRHRVRATNTYTNPTTQERCSAVSEVSFGADGKWSAPVNTKVCRGANGKLREM